MSCGEIVPRKRRQTAKQELFHRNFENGHPKLAGLSLESERSPQKVAIYYV